MIRVHNGTRPEGPLLCYRCTSATVMRAAAESQERTYCSIIEGFVPIKVVQCSDFRDKSEPTLCEMREVAWVIHTSKSGRRIGFLSPQEASDKLGDYDIPGEWE